MKNCTLVPLAVLLMGLCSPALAAKDTIVFSAAPTESSGEVKAFYQPLLDLVAKASGKRVVLELAPNYVEYTARMRKGAYDMVFDGPHFVSWRMEHLGHVPLVRLPGKIQIVVAVRDEDGVRAADGRTARVRLSLA